MSSTERFLIQNYGSDQIVYDMKIFVTNTPQGLIPMYSSDLDSKQKLKLHKSYVCEISEVRNPKLHKKFMGLIRVVFENQSQFTNEKELRKQLLIQAGFYYEVVNPDGTKRPEAMSLSFDEMDDFEFRNVYDRVLDVIILSYNWSAEEIEENLIDYM